MARRKHSEAQLELPFTPTGEQNPLASALAEALGQSRYDMWIRPARVRLELKQWLYIYAPNMQIYRRLLEYRPLLEEHFRHHDTLLGVRIFPPLRERRALQALQRFVLGGENRYIESLLQQLVTQPLDATPILWLYGREGVGKSLFAKTLQTCRQLLFPHEKVHFYPAKEFLQLLTRGKVVPQSSHLWIVDDLLGPLSLSEEEQLFQLLQSWPPQGCTLVVTSEDIPRGILSSSRLCSLFQQGIVARLDSPSEGTRKLLLLTNCPRACHYASEIIQWLCQSFSSPTELFQAWKKVEKSFAPPANLTEVKLLFRHPPRPSQSPSQGPEEFLQFFLREQGLSLEELSAKRQRRRIRQARKLLLHLWQHLFQLSPAQMSKLLPALSPAACRRQLKTPLEENLREDFEELIHLWETQSTSPTSSTFPLGF